MVKILLTVLHKLNKAIVKSNILKTIVNYREEVINLQVLHNPRVIIIVHFIKPF